MDDLLLREVCELANVTRRAVQGYEKFNLIAPVGRNKMGYLLYDKSIIDRIEYIRQLQKLGFSLREIKRLENMPGDELKLTLKTKLQDFVAEYNNARNTIIYIENILNGI